MPKIKKQEMSIDEEEEEGEDFEDDEEDIYDTPPQRIAREMKVETRGRKKRIEAPPIEPKRRFGIVPANQPRVMDIETNEVIADGEYATLQLLTEILERMERMEIQIGTAIGE